MINSNSKQSYIHININYYFLYKVKKFYLQNKLIHLLKPPQVNSCKYISKATTIKAIWVGITKPFNCSDVILLALISNYIFS